MSEKTIHLNEGIIKNELKELVRSSVEDTLNGLLEAKANQTIQVPPNMSAQRNSQAIGVATILLYSFIPSQDL